MFNNQSFFPVECDRCRYFHVGRVNAAVGLEVGIDDKDLPSLQRLTHVNDRAGDGAVGKRDIDELAPDSLAVLRSGGAVVVYFHSIAGARGCALCLRGRVVTGEGDAVEHLAFHRWTGDAQVAHHVVAAEAVHAVVHQEVVGKVGAQHLHVVVRHIVCAEHQNAGAVGHVEGHVEGLVLVANNVHVLASREEARMVSIDGVGHFLEQVRAFHTLALQQIHFRLFLNVGHGQVAVVVGWQLQLVSGLVSEHQFEVVELAVVAYIEGEVHVVGILAEDVLERVLQQVGDFGLEAAAQHGLNLCADVRPQLHFVVDAELVFAVGAVFIDGGAAGERQQLGRQE